MNSAATVATSRRKWTVPQKYVYWNWPHTYHTQKVDIDNFLNLSYEDTIHHEETHSTWLSAYQRHHAHHTSSRPVADELKAPKKHRKRLKKCKGPMLGQSPPMFKVCWVDWKDGRCFMVMATLNLCNVSVLYMCWIYISFYLSIFMFFRISMFLSIYRLFEFIYLPIVLYLPIILSTYLCVCVPFYLSFYLYLSMLFFWFVNLSAFQSVHSPVYC